MTARCSPRSLTFLLVAGLALALAAGLAACSGTPGERPAPPATATATAPPAATPAPPAATPPPTTTAPPEATATPMPPPNATSTATPSPTATVTPTPPPASAATPSATATATPTTFRYNSFDRTGAAAAPGSYAFLMPDGQSTSVVTTYEQLRTESTVMRVNVKDEHGASWAGLYDAVVVGDVVEWREADDCWTRYQVAETPQAGGGLLTRDFGVEWVTYTYTGCSGTISGAVASTSTWDPANLQSPDIVAPVRHGPWQLVPLGWTGYLEPQVAVPTQQTIATDNITEVRQHRLWRDPTLPAGWQLHRAEAGDEGIDGVSATYTNAAGYLALRVQIRSLGVLGSTRLATTVDPQARVVETRIVDGHVAYVKYSPTNDRDLSTVVRIYHEATGIEYLVIGMDPSIAGSNIDATIEIARSLLPE